MTLDIQALLERAGLTGLQTVALDRIIANPDNPRRDFDPDELDALAGSIRERGLLQPVSLFPADAAGVHILRFGERRVRAARLAGLTEISAVICDPPDRAAQLVDQIIENDQRVALSALDMSRAIAALSAAGLTKSAIAAQLGRAAAMISLYAAVIEMPDFLQALADQVAIRSLHDLYREWRRNPEAVMAFLEVMPTDAINRRTILSLAGDAAERRPAEGTGPSDLTPGPVQAAGATPTVAGRAGRGERSVDPRDVGHVRVAHKARAGTLLFAPRIAPGDALVRFDDRAAPERVRCAELLIVSTAP